MPVFEIREEGIIVPAKSSRFYACLCSLADQRLHGLPKLTKSCRRPADSSINAGVSTDPNLHRLAMTCAWLIVETAALSLTLQAGYFHKWQDKENYITPTYFRLI